MLRRTCSNGKTDRPIFDENKHKKALTMTMVTCKVPLIFIVDEITVYSE